MHRNFITRQIPTMFRAQTMLKRSSASCVAAPSNKRRVKASNSIDPITLENIEDIPTCSLVMFEDEQGEWIFRTSTLRALWKHAELENATALNPFSQLPLSHRSGYENDDAADPLSDPLLEISCPSLFSTDRLIVDVCVRLQVHDIHICPLLLRVQRCGRLKRIFATITTLFANNFTMDEKRALSPPLGMLSTFEPYWAPLPVWRQEVMFSTLRCAGVRSGAELNLQKRGAAICWVAFAQVIPELKLELAGRFNVL